MQINQRTEWIKIAYYRKVDRYKVIAKDFLIISKTIGYKGILQQKQINLYFTVR